MTGLNKYDQKEKRKQRLRNHIAKDLASPKYRQRILERKRTDNEDGSYYFADRYYDEDDDEQS